MQWLPTLAQMAYHSTAQHSTAKLPKTWVCATYQFPSYRHLQHVLQVSSAGPRKPTVVAHFMPADVSAIKQESDILKDCKIYFINHGSHSKQDMEALVKKLGGTVSNRCISFLTV